MAGDVIQSPTNPAAAVFFPRQWNMRQIRANVAWAAGRRGSSSVKVAILDTGLDYTHADMLGRVDMVLSTSFIADPVPAGQPAWLDRHYHGTHVGATVASNAIAAAGVTSQVTLIAVKVLNRFGSGSTSGVLAGIRYAADVGADVINMSLGSAFLKSANPGFISILNRATNYAHSKGTTIVVAAGNSAWDLDHNADGYAAYCNTSNVICVSATGPTSEGGVDGPWTNIDAFAYYSNFGNSAINVAAPGGNNATAVWAACNRFSLIYPICGTGIYILGLQGTSMASPHVAGLAALLAEQYGKNPAKIKAAIEKGAIDLGKPGNDPFYGKGRIDVPNSIGF
jgi:subtilisin family serine protease